MGQQERAIVSKQMLYFMNCDVKIHHIDSAKNPVDLQTDGKKCTFKVLVHRWYRVIKIICDLFEIWFKTIPKDIRHGQKSVLEAQCTYKYDIFHCIYDRVAS